MYDQVLGSLNECFSLNVLAPVIPLGGMIMAAGYAIRICGVRTDPDDVADTFPLRFRLAVAILCNTETVR
jgi:hypothetical protein